MKIDLTKGNKLISGFMGAHISQYRKSGIFDVNNVEVLEGSIINANGYKSNFGKKYFHCVEFYKGAFGSNIYSDFEPLSRYGEIEVIGHCTEYIHLLDIGDGYEGNLGAAISVKLNYHESWDTLMPVVEKVQCLKVGTVDEDGYTYGTVHYRHERFNGTEWSCNIFGGINILHVAADKTRTFSSWDLPNIHVHSKSSIESVWLAVVQFIEWYNKKNETHGNTTIRNY